MVNIIPSLPVQLVNGTLADAGQVMADFLAIVSAVNSGAASAGANSDITSLSGLTTPLGVFYGGTGAATAANARTNLGAAASGANSDITAILGLTTPLGVSQGGTGANVAGKTAANNIGAAELGANSSITSLAGLTTPLPISEGGTGASTLAGAQTNLGINLTHMAQAKASINTGSATLNSSFNVSSVTKLSTGIVTVNFGANVSADAVCHVTTSQGNSWTRSSPVSPNSVTVYCTAFNGAQQDDPFLQVLVI